MNDFSIIKIDTNALIHNLHRIRELVGQSRVLAMVKANAYGHGLLNTVSALSYHIDL